MYRYVAVCIVSNLHTYYTYLYNTEWFTGHVICGIADKGEDIHHHLQTGGERERDNNERVRKRVNG